jgi:acetylornithine/succinyldiaminopimelate/putrescine aminotransferase
MHCCDIARTGQTLPVSLPNEWLPTNTIQRDRINSSSKSNDIPTYAQLNQQLKETMNTTETTPTNSSAEAAETERKLMLATYEEKRQKNYEVCFSKKTPFFLI